MPIMATNFAKTLVCKHEYDVKLGRHKEHTPNANDHHMPLNEPPPLKISAYATGFTNPADVCSSAVYNQGRLATMFESISYGLPSHKIRYIARRATMDVLNVC